MESGLAGGIEKFSISGLVKLIDGTNVDDPGGIRFSSRGPQR